VVAKLAAMMREPKRIAVGVGSTAS
jgi:hypothetical protein